ncbi:MAG TPA: glycosyltransferase [Candidatus Cryosericum sp.]|nr:glycosyltransferase [Candidatus Cryosericum sp.]
MLVYYWGTYDKDYPRNRILMAGLRASGAVVREFNVPLWKDTSQKLRQARKGWIRPGLIIRWLGAYGSLTARFLASPRPDFLFVGYSGHFDVFPAKLLCRLRRVPLVFDAFLSLYDSLVLDRDAVPRDGPKARLLAWVDRNACRLADRVLLDTEAHVDFFIGTFHQPKEKFWVLPIGADDLVFVPGVGPSDNGRPYTVLHFGRYIPLHGLETVVRAARLLEERGIACRFLMVGDGEERSRIEALARSLGTRSLEFRGSEPPERLVRTIREADLCLGIFGESGKASRVVPNKVYEAMAVGKAVITGDSPAARELLRDGVDCLLCRRGDPAALAEAIQRIMNDESLARRLAQAGRERFEERASPRVIGRILVGRLREWDAERAAAA